MPDLRAALTFFFTCTFIGSVFVTEPFSGFRTDQLPIPQITPPIQPEGYTFAIRGLIYLYLFASAAFGLAVRVEHPGWESARFPLLLSLALGTPWLWVANQNAIAATALIFAMAAFAIIALMRTPDEDAWILRAPVAIYAGWLTAASFVSLGSTAAGYGLIMDQTGWAITGIIAALLVTLTIQNRAVGAPEYALTVVWALVGIIVANQFDVLPVSITALVGITLILLTLARNTARAPAG